MRDLRRIVLAIMCLGFTGTHVAWADAAHDPRTASTDWIDDPYAPHRTHGSVLRIGTVVGSVTDERLTATGLGPIVGLGYRFGRLGVATEYQYLMFQNHSPADSTRLGNGHRLSIVGRVDVVRLDSRTVGPNTMVAVFVEGGAGVAWNDWWRPGAGEAARLVPADSKRVEGIAGIGIDVDHRLQEAVRFPKRIAWTLGLRVTGSPPATETATVCRSTETVCRTAPPMMSGDQGFVDRSMLFQSSFGMLW